MIGKPSPSSLKKEKLPFIETANPKLTTIYKHYILIFDSKKDEGEDCIVFNTQNGTTTHVKTGLNIFQRILFSICHWKDSIFILFEIEAQGGSGLFPKNEHDANVHFLHVIEKDGKWITHNK